MIIKKQHKLRRKVFPKGEYEKLDIIYGQSQDTDVFLSFSSVFLLSYKERMSSVSLVVRGSSRLFIERRFARSRFLNGCLK
jgi:hypothetical protein